jgi:hypothetical protein
MHHHFYTNNWVVRPNYMVENPHFIQIDIKTEQMNRNCREICAAQKNGNQTCDG